MVDLKDIERRLDALLGKSGEPTLEELFLTHYAP